MKDSLPGVDYISYTPADVPEAANAPRCWQIHAEQKQHLTGGLSPCTVRQDPSS